jgi:acyl transferase domain-containing protein/acyl carrier protein
MLDKDRYAAVLFEITGYINSELNIEIHGDREDVEFSDLGLDSMDYVGVSAFIQNKYDIDIGAEELYGYNTLGEVIKYAILNFDIDKKESRSDVKEENSAADVAVVGMGFVMPGATTRDELWSKLTSNETLFTSYPAERNEEFKKIDAVGCFINGVDQFDHKFFGISPREARLMDPQQRLLLRSVWHALEDANIRPSSLADKKVDVLIGSSNYEYLDLIKHANQDEEPHLGTGVGQSILANRISYFLDLKGASETIDTACSSSLVAVNKAVENIRSGASELSIVGGVNIMTSTIPYKCFTKAGMLSGSGKCSPFDDNADGYIRGESIVVLILKSLSAAIRDGDVIHAIIKGGAVRHGGKTNSLTAPSPNEQANVIRCALENANVSSTDIGYIETHGTGTKLGDPIEVLGIKKSCDIKDAHREPPCYLGAIKGMYGHQEAAAGITGVLKAILTLKNKIIPLNPGFNKLNRNISLNNTRFKINDKNIDFKAFVKNGDEQPRMAGVSSFGFGGTNAHLIIQEANYSPKMVKNNGELVFLFSAKSENSVRCYIKKFVKFLCRDKSHSNEILPNISYSLLTRRDHHEVRVGFSAKTAEALVDELGAYLKNIESTFLSENSLIQQYISGAPPADRELFDDIPGSVSLPLYEFDEVSHWPIDIKSWLTYKVNWIDAHLTDKRHVKETLYILIKDQMEAFHSECELSSNDLILSIDYEKSLIRVFGDDSNIVDMLPISNLNGIAQYFSKVSTVIDLVDLQDVGCMAQLTFRLRLIQEVIKQRGFDTVNDVIHLSSHVFNDKKELSTGFKYGLNALYKHLSSEVHSLKSVSVDINNINAYRCIRDIIDKDINIAHNQYRLIGNTLCLPELVKHDLISHVQKNLSEKDKPVIITGGTGNIGMLLANKLLESGYKNIHLWGRKSIAITDGSYDNEAIKELCKNRSNSFITYHNVNLEDKDAVRAKLLEISINGNQIHSVYHCAGSVDTVHLQFWSKPIESILTTLSPKVAGTINILDGLPEKEVTKVILFSSASSVFPEMATGIIDYAIANTQMADIGRNYINRGYKCRTVYWGAWFNIGMAKEVAGLSTDNSLSQNEALGVLDGLFQGDGYTNDLICIKKALPLYVDSTDKTNDQSRETNNSTTLNFSVSELYEVKNYIKQNLSVKLNVDSGSITDHEDFENMGVDSIIITEMTDVVEKRFSVTVNPNIWEQYPNLDELAPYVCSQIQKSSDENENNIAEVPCSLNYNVSNKSELSKKYAIVGMSCNFPKSDSIDAFWNNLVAGKDCVSEVPNTRWDVHKYYSENNTSGKTISKWGGFLDDKCFKELKYLNDAGISDECDPLIKLFVDSACQCVDDYNYHDRDDKLDRIGVFVGARSSGYASTLTKIDRSSIIWTGQNFIASHVSQHLNLKGPSLVVDTACSSSMTALHLAKQSLDANECDMALVGGVERLLDEKVYLFLSAAQALSQKGKCCTFDRSADGFVPGEGAGCVMIKRLDKALSDNDKIYSVIESTAINNDGKTMGVTTPSMEGQSFVINDALQKTKIPMDEVGYIEVHGTGTKIGDPIELSALNSVYKNSQCQSVALGSVKTNIGHLLSAAGTASLIKVSLSLFNETLPPSINCSELNPRFDFERSPFYVVRKKEPWPVDKQYAGISSFGFGGTNTHTIVSSVNIYK